MEVDAASRSDGLSNATGTFLVKPEAGPNAGRWCMVYGRKFAWKSAADKFQIGTVFPDEQRAMDWVSRQAYPHPIEWAELDNDEKRKITSQPYWTGQPELKLAAAYYTDDQMPGHQYDLQF